ncbi:MAG: sigma-70 family RNA polymerase sigma factor [Anaerolineales bacterium]|nr:sigma-70 family RNA polymerase sigma factor [Anaerolineales bacterium]
MSQNVDHHLILQLQSGDLNALGVLFDRHRHLVYRTALAITNDAEVASDLLQDVFLRIHRFSHRIDPKRPFEPWLYRVTTNLAYSWMKRRNRLTRCLKEMAEWLSRERRPTPHHIAERDEEWRWVQQAVATLPLAQRVVVVLYYVNDLSLQEIAEILDIPVGTVKSRLHYGRRALKKHLGMQGEMLAEVYYEFTS